MQKDNQITDLENSVADDFLTIGEQRIKLAYGRRAGDPLVIESSQWQNPPDYDNIVIIIPAYNEERFIGSVVLKACQQAHTVIVVDDGSTDETAQVAAAAGAKVLKHQQNQGKGSALNTGFQAIRELNPEAVVLIDADGQHRPEEIQQVLAPILQGQADVVLGSRYLGEENGTPRHRVLGHHVFNSLTHWTSGVDASDSQSGYRAFSNRAIQVLSFSSSGFSVESEMQFLIREYNLRYVEVPITIRYTDKPKRNVVHHGLMVLNGILRLTGQYRPLMFIGLPGLVLLLAGAGWGWWVVDIYSRIKQLAVGYAMISILLVIIGVVMLSTGIILHSIRGLLIDLLQKQKLSD
jgi:glycosyltransferase involved in cell wall biosynthesis